MAVKPILFNTEMVRAILDGRKTQTRMIVKPIKSYFIMDGMPTNQPHYNVGDILWVRETWQRLFDHRGWRYEYRADHNDDEPLRLGGMYIAWRPSIHMPREAARLFLRVNEVRIERLQDISPLDVKAEGIEITCYEDEYDVEMSDEAMERLLFSVLWDKTIKPADSPRYGWFANPWVWVIEFERLDGKPAGLWADRDTAQFGDQDTLMPAT